MTASPDGPIPQLVHFAAGEICVLVEAKASNDLGASYEAVRRALNAHIMRHLDDPPAWETLSEAARLDLAPTALRAAFRGRPDVLQPPRRGQDDVSPTVSLPGASPPAALLFFQVGTAEDNAEAANPNQARREWVRELVNILNAVNARAPLPIADQASEAGRFVAVTPNWLAAGTQGEMTGGGPGSYPLPAPPGRWDIHFQNTTLDGVIERAKQPRYASSVAVAVLDTCPDERTVRAKAKSLGSGHPLNRVGAPGGTGGASITLDPPAGTQFQHLHHCVVNWNKVPADDAEYDSHFRMADHGLFVAGVIQNLAPWAAITIMRVLNDWGVGDLHTLTTALAALAQELTRDTERRLVINLSLMVDQPPPLELYHLFWPTVAKSTPSPDVLKGDDPIVIKPTLTLADAALACAISALPADRALIVAAAGNDAVPSQPRPEPRFPARYDSVGTLPNVVGVAAITTGGQPAIFSNEADLSANPRGIAAFGGNAARQASGPSVIVDGANGQKDAVVGIFSADTLPITGDHNKTGWVYWAGTSFATPIISGIAADLWAAGQPAADVAAVVHGYATAAQPLLLTNGIVATQAP